MIKDKFDADKAGAQRILAAAGKVFADARLGTADGCRFDFDDAWIHLRPSNTEPVMRIIVEAGQADVARVYVEKVLALRR